MSDYVHQKAVRLPFPKEIMKACKTEDPWDCEGFIEGLLGSLWDRRSGNSFKLEYTQGGFYIDWVYYHTYGDESGDYGSARLLTEKELEVIKPYFDKLQVEYKNTDLRVVDYCYYNACEAPDYYDIVTEETDHSSIFISK